MAPLPLGLAAAPRRNRSEAASAAAGTPVLEFSISPRCPYIRGNTRFVSRPFNFSCAGMRAATSTSRRCMNSSSAVKRRALACGPYPPSQRLPGQNRTHSSADSGRTSRTCSSRTRCRSSNSSRTSGRRRPDMPRVTSQ
jgi:hypothetical protein